MEAAGNDTPGDAVMQADLQPGQGNAEVLSRITSFVDESDIEGLAQLCDELMRDLVALIGFVQDASPSGVLRSIAALFDKEELSGSIEDPVPVGQILLFAQFVTQRGYASRQSLRQLLPEPRHQRFAAFMSSIHRTMPLPMFSEEHRTLIQDWIAALFGSDGISDDLIRRSPPMTILCISPTIFEQCIMAFMIGLIDLEAIRSALTYYLQDLLSYALPAALSYVTSELDRCSATERMQYIPGVGYHDTALIAQTSRKREACLEIMCSLLGAESCPVVVRRIMASDVINVCESCKKEVMSAEANSLVSSMRQLLVDIPEDRGRTSTQVDTTDAVNVHL